MEGVVGQGPDRLGVQELRSLQHDGEGLGLDLADGVAGVDDVRESRRRERLLALSPGPGAVPGAVSARVPVAVVEGAGALGEGRRLRVPSAAPLAPCRIVHRPQHGPLVHAEPAGETARVLRAHGPVADARHHRGRHPQRGDLPLDGVEVDLGDRGTDGELEHRLAALDEVDDGLIPLGEAQIAGVHPVGLDGDVRLRDEFLVLLEGAQRGLLPGGIAVEGEDHLAGQPAAVRVQAQAGAAVRVPHHATHDLHVLRTEGGAAGGDRCGNACEVRGHHVGVALDDHHPFLGGDVLAREVQPVEHVGLVVDRGLGGVEVLGALVRLQQTARPEADGVAGDLADRPDQPAAEAVVDPALALGHDAAGHQLVLGEPPLAQHTGDGVPALRGEAHAEPFGGGAVEAALGEEPAPHFRLGRVELFAVVLLGDRMRVEQAATGAEVGAIALPVLGVLVVQLHAVAAREHLDGLDEAEVVDLLDEGDDVPALAAAEAVPVAQLRADVEGGGLLVVEGAQPLHGTDPAGAQRDVLADDLVQPGALADQLHISTPDQSLGQLLTAPIRVRAAGCPRP